jgi:biotin carboxylase
VKSPLRVVVLVDACHAATQLVQEMNRRGFACVSVKRPGPPPSSMFPEVPADSFLAKIAHCGDTGATAARLRRFQPACVIAGSEEAVELADQLAAALGLPGNGVEKSAVRRDKYAMANAVWISGLRVARQSKHADVDSAAAWLRESGLPRVVVKPLHAAGTESVFVCSSEAELRRHAAAMLGGRHHLGLVNDEILVQEFVEGNEYIVNTVSCDGVHRLAGVWLYHKRPLQGRAAIYDWDELVDPADPLVAGLADYAFGVLDALGIRYGPAHAEIMVDADGPVLIECNARMDGLEYQPLTRRCMGYGQIELTCDAYMDPPAFFAGGVRYAQKEHASNVVMVTPQDATVQSFGKLAEIRRLPSFVGLLLRVRPGDALRATVDYATSPGVVFLAHSNASVVREDRLCIQNLEDSGLFAASGAETATG